MARHHSESLCSVNSEALRHVISGTLFNPPVKSIGQIRRERLQLLQRETGLTLSAISERLGRSKRDSTLSQVIAAAPDSKTGEPRQMGDKQARLLEQTFDKPMHWFDRDPDFDLLLAQIAVLQAQEPRHGYGAAWPFTTAYPRFAKLSPAMKAMIDQTIANTVAAWEADHAAPEAAAPTAPRNR